MAMPAYTKKERNKRKGERGEDERGEGEEGERERERERERPDLHSSKAVSISDLGRKQILLLAEGEMYASYSLIS